MVESPGIHSALENARKELLDLSARNRLISTPRGRTRSTSIEFVGESTAETYRRLVTDKKSMSILPGQEGPEDQPRLIADDSWEASTAGGIATDQTDGHLQTGLTSEALQKRLLKLFYEAKTSEEEQGVNTLYLALGFLRWFEAPSSDVERFAPLLLIPVALDRKTARSRFRLSALDEEITTNLSLQAKLAQEFALKLPDVPDVEDLDPAAYFKEVAEAVADQPRWEVRHDDQVLWLFSFAKFLMYRDLKPETWPADRPLGEHRLLRGLLKEGFHGEPPICGDDDPIDDLVVAANMTHVMDADSSQTVAIEEVRTGRHLVVQGPPGTGKSQTIVNLIATAVKQGKTVLFVAEKMAALEVVKRRLDTVGLGPLCLELHSHKAQKKRVLDELNRTLQLTRPRVQKPERTIDSLQAARNKLNRHAELMHQPIAATRVSPYQAVGTLVRLRAAGLRPLDFSFADSVLWSTGQREEKRELLGDLIRHLAELGSPSEHPWCGVGVDQMLPTDVDRLIRRIGAAQDRLARLFEAAGELAERINTPLTPTLQGISNLARLARRLANAPPLDREAIVNPAWRDRRDAITDLVTAGLLHAQSREQLEGLVADVAWETDVRASRRHLAAHGRSWLRWLNRDYRRAQAMLRGILREAPPKPLADRLKLLDTLLAGQKAASALGQADDLGQAAFGTAWRGLGSDWEALSSTAAWEAECREAEVRADFRELLARLDDQKSCKRLVKRIAEDLKPVREELQSMFSSLELDLPRAFGEANIDRLPLETVLSKLERWVASAEALRPWIAYYTRLCRAKAEGLEAIVQRLDGGVIATAHALDSFEMAFCEEVIREAFRAHPQLQEFEGKSHEQLRDEFRRLDEERIGLARAEVALAHYENVPRGNAGIGELGTITREIEKRRRHKPIRQLLLEAGKAVQQIKPVFMMSPISVAQFLAPGLLDFDLLLIDEASQVRPVDALGAIVRSNQIVVVGDDKQLPPTRFFSKVVGDDDEPDDEEGAVRVGDMESVLGLCRSQGIPQRMLRWHYRSQHQSLIAVSNREFYDSRLYVVPSAERDAGDKGLCFRHVEDGVFDRGGSSTNRQEALAVAGAVINHACSRAGRSLGVGAFSIHQRDAILDELELLRRQHPELEPFFAPGGAEPFFVKNLENIQGDERDVIFISVGYGRDKSGFMSMSFGPLNNDGGERRLNVLISRARQRCEVFSSITADDIDLSRTQARGAVAFKTFLHYARTRCLDVGIPTGRGCDSEFEEEVARGLRRHGYAVEPQVGVAGFFVDLAVVDPEQPGRYLLGVECDGAAYHSSRSARDRDRLRQNVLEDRGWTVHRIWSTDWFHQPQEQIQKLLSALERAKTKAPMNSATNSEPVHIERHEDHESHGAAPAAEPYLEAGLSLSDSRPLCDVPVDEVARIVTDIVRVEGPVHQDEVARRLAGLWGYDRTGARIVEAVRAGLEKAARRGWLEHDGPFYQPPEMSEVPIRSREGVSSSTLRRPDMLPPVEIRKALVQVVETHAGAKHDEAVVEVTRLLGFRATSAQLKQVVMQEVERLVREGGLSQQNEKLYVP